MIGIWNRSILLLINSLNVTSIEIINESGLSSEYRFTFQIEFDI